jgi:DNA repair protein RecN (Recombination protein N)
MDEPARCLNTVVRCLFFSVCSVRAASGASAGLKLPAQAHTTTMNEQRSTKTKIMLFCARMLLELRVENYAVIDNAVVEFAPGLNLLTGETGAGKSILVGALALLLGEKASSDAVRHGAEKAIVAGVFEAPEKHVAVILEANGLDSNGDELILRREIAVNGKGRVWVNNQPATVGVLKQLAARLGTIHSQAQSMFAFAFDAGERLALLDDFAALDTACTTEVFNRWLGIRARIRELETEGQQQLRLLDLWSFQKKEIESAQLQPGEDQQLEGEKRVLANAERIYSAAMAAYHQLYDSNTSAAASIRVAMRSLEELTRFEEKFRDSAAALESARITVEDIGATLRDYAEGIDASPGRLAEIEDRLALIDRLKRKYGHSVEEILAHGDEVTRKLSEIENKEEILKQLRRDLEATAAEYLKRTRELSRRRCEAARKLEKLVEGELNDLAMKARFKVEVSGSDEEGNWTAGGFDRVSYLISTNAGLPLGPVEQIASGGELSRVMLALKTVVQGGSGSRRPAGQSSAAMRTLVFDEIDTGIGGRAAEAVGRKLKSLAQSNQLICITHLPQVACFADHHYVIEKKESGGKTRTQIRRLEAKQRTEEIARMLSGATITDHALKNAAQMLKAAVSG